MVDIRRSKTVILTILGDFLGKCTLENDKNSKFRIVKRSKWQLFRVLKMTKIDFMQNLSGRRISIFRNCNFGIFVSFRFYVKTFFAKESLEKVFLEQYQRVENTGLEKGRKKSSLKSFSLRPTLDGEQLSLWTIS